MKSIPEVIRKDHNFGWFIGTQVVVNLSGMAWGFLAVYALQRWNLPDGQVGGYTAWMLIGQAIANLVMGFVADRRGYKLVVELSILMAVVALAITFLASDPTWIYLVFVLRGGSLAGFMLSMLMVFEFSTPDVRPTYIGLNNTVVGIVSLIAPIIGSGIASLAGYPVLFQVSTFLGLAGLVMFFWLVREPRRVRPGQTIRDTGDA